LFCVGLVTIFLFDSCSTSICFCLLAHSKRESHFWIVTFWGWIFDQNEHHILSCYRHLECEKTDWDEISKKVLNWKGAWKTVDDGLTTFFRPRAQKRFYPLFRPCVLNCNNEVTNASRRIENSRTHDIHLVFDALRSYALSRKKLTQKKNEKKCSGSSINDVAKFIYIFYSFSLLSLSICSQSYKTFFFFANKEFFSFFNVKLGRFIINIFVQDVTNLQA